MSARIFVSYRREDSADVCGRIYDRLVARFGPDAIFKDVDSIPAGADFMAQIHGVLAQCALQLVVIGPRWQGHADAEGHTRLEQPSDFVRLEVEAALQRGLPLVPLLVQGAAMPTADELPPSLRPLATRNAVPVRRDPDFNTDMARVLVAIERTVGPAVPAAWNAPPQPTSAAQPAVLAQPPRVWNATNDPAYRQTRPFGDTPDRFIRTVAIGRHRIDVRAKGFAHQVFYDGYEVGRGTKVSTIGYKTYPFTANEDGISVSYEVEVRVKNELMTSRADVHIRRNGQEIYRD